MKNSKPTTHASAKSIAPHTDTTGAKAYGCVRAEGNAAMQ
jgi:hypothetical protein